MPTRTDPIETGVNPFGAYLRAELRARRWSIRSLAARSGVDHSTIVRLIHGHREPRFETVCRLQEALGDVGGEPMTAIEDAGTKDPVQRVVDALQSDSKLDRQGVATVLAYYLRLRRPPVRPTDRCR